MQGEAAQKGGAGGAAGEACSGSEYVMSCISRRIVSGLLSDWPCVLLYRYSASDSTDIFIAAEGEEFSAGTEQGWTDDVRIRFIVYIV